MKYVVATAISLGMLGLGIFSFWWVHIRPERQLRRQFYAEAMGRQARGGLPERDSIFIRMERMENDVASVKRALHIVPAQRRARAVR